MSSWGQAFPQDIQRQRSHIFYKELHAACEGLVAASQVDPNCRRFVLGCDNTGVIGTLRRGYSHLHDAVNMISHLYARMPRDFDLTIIYVPSHENLADDLSHLRSVTSSREALMNRILGP